MNTLINIIDVECTCWINEPTPMGMVQEIIEIGIAQVDLKTMKIVKSEGILVKPTMSTVSWSCTHLTSITVDMLENAPTFHSAVEYMIKEYGSKWNFRGSYGNFDRDMFEKQCKLLDIEYPLCNQHVNVKALIRSVFPSVKGLGSALNMIGMKFDGRPHRGVDDAINTTNLYIKMVATMQKGLLFNESEIRI